MDLVTNPIPCRDNPQGRRRATQRFSPVAPEVHLMFAPMPLRYSRLSHPFADFDAGVLIGVLALLLAATLAQAFGLSAELIGSWFRAIPDIPPSSALPSVPFGQLRESVWPLATVVLLAGIELLRSLAADGAVDSNSHFARTDWRILVRTVFHNRKYPDRTAPSATPSPGSGYSFPGRAPLRARICRSPLSA